MQQPVHPAAVWQAIQKYLLPYHQTTEQLLSSGCKTPQLILSTWKNNFSCLPWRDYNLHFAVQPCVVERHGRLNLVTRNGGNADLLLWIFGAKRLSAPLNNWKSTSSQDSTHYQMEQLHQLGSFLLLNVCHTFSNASLHLMCSSFWKQWLLVPIVLMWFTVLVLYRFIIHGYPRYHTTNNTGGTQHMFTQFIIFGYTFPSGTWFCSSCVIDETKQGTSAEFSSSYSFHHFEVTFVCGPRHWQLAVVHCGNIKRDKLLRREQQPGGHYVAMVIS